MVNGQEAKEMNSRLPERRPDESSDAYLDRLANDRLARDIIAMAMPRLRGRIKVMTRRWLRQYPHATQEEREEKARIWTRMLFKETLGIEEVNEKTS